MITLKCRNCGAEMTIDLKGEVTCPYCGAHSYFSDAELRSYKQFRLNMLQYLSAAADAKADAAQDNSLWANSAEKSFVTASGQNVLIRYLFYTEDDGVSTFTARDSVVQVFAKDSAYKADLMQRNLGMLHYPPAAIKNLSRSFPTVKTRLPLDDGSILLAVDKPENVYPLFAFGNIKPDHVAWIVSRLENMCCVFAYSGIVHGGINPDTVYINPRTHEAFLYGSWWKARRMKEVLPGGQGQDLRDLRSTAIKLSGQYLKASPAAFQAFLHGAPAGDAYADFAKWDEVIEKGFGGHKFVKW